MADILQIGITGLRSSQTALTVTGHNITNANTEGYSRQVINQTTNMPQAKDGNWIGAGSVVTSVNRVYDQFLTSQLWRDNASFHKFDTLATNAGQIDSLLADSKTGVQPGLEKMFGALQTVTDDPASLPARAVLLSESQGLIDRFKLIDDRLNAQNRIVNGQITVLAEEITEIAKAVAELNEEIQIASASLQGIKPNDLLDRRDLLVKKLAEKVSVTVSEQDNMVWNITIGKGQPLVVGKTHSTLYAAAGTTDPSRVQLFMQAGDRSEQISSAIEGGKLGGTLDFRREVLDPARNEMGRVALVINQTFNEQHKLGLDYDGRKGVDYFTDINEPQKTYLRVLSDANNARPPDRVVSVHIKDAGALTASDYKLEFPGPNNYSYRITRVSDGEIIKTSSISDVFPVSVEMDGFELRFEAGSFKAGDKFLLSPSGTGARDLALNLTRPEQVAVASPVVAGASLGNTGNGKITQPNVYDTRTPYFAKQGELTPPIKVVFTSPTTYDVLDNSDPGHPIPLFPPLMNQRFTPGVSNKILPENTGRMAFTSFGGFLAHQPTFQALAPAPTVNAQNGFAAERFSIAYTDPRTGQVTTQPAISTPANASAKDIAAEINRREGVHASARTTIELTNFTEDANPFLPENIYVNGVVLTDTLGPNQTKYMANYPEDVPNPITPAFLADRINANYDFQAQGIVAKSDGEKLTIIALNGEDLNIEVSGDLGSGFSVGNGQEIILEETGEAPFVPLSAYTGYDFSQNGPYSYRFDVPGQGSFDIQLTDNYPTATAMLNGIRTQLQNAGMALTGNIEVSISERGTISFKQSTVMNGMGINGSNKMTMGGQLKVVTDPGYSLVIAPPGNNLFPVNPEAEPEHFGFNFNIDGVPKRGDSFTLDFNEDGRSDSRNGLMLGALQSKGTLNNNANYTDAYSMLVERIGSITNRAQINSESAEVLKQHSENTLSSLSGVNLDEEAAALIKYELAYNASAQVISTAKTIFDTLIATFR